MAVNRLKSRKISLNGIRPQAVISEHLEERRTLKLPISVVYRFRNTNSKNYMTNNTSYHHQGCLVKNCVFLGKNRT